METYIYTLKYVSTHSVYSETYFQTFRTKLRYLNKYEGEKKRKEREVTTLGTLSDVTRRSTIHLHPSSEESNHVLALKVLQYQTDHISFLLKHSHCD